MAPVGPNQAPPLTTWFFLGCHSKSIMCLLFYIIYEMLKKYSKYSNRCTSFGYFAFTGSLLLGHGIDYRCDILFDLVLYMDT
jgi:hypothetical protein